MALEINEIGIRMRVFDGNGEAKPSPKKPDQSGCGDEERQQIVEDCVQRVLKILKATQER